MYILHNGQQKRIELVVQQWLDYLLSDRIKCSTHKKMYFIIPFKTQRVLK